MLLVPPAVHSPHDFFSAVCLFDATCAVEIPAVNDMLLEETLAAGGKTWALSTPFSTMSYLVTTDPVRYAILKYVEIRFRKSYSVCQIVPSVVCETLGRWHCSLHFTFLST